MFVSTNYNKNIRETWITGQNNTLLGTQYTEITTTTTRLAAFGERAIRKLNKSGLSYSLNDRKNN